MAERTWKYTITLPYRITVRRFFSLQGHSLTAAQAKEYGYRMACASNAAGDTPGFELTSTGRKVGTYRVDLMVEEFQPRTRMTEAEAAEAARSALARIAGGIA